MRRKPPEFDYTLAEKDFAKVMEARRETPHSPSDYANAETFLRKLSSRRGMITLSQYHTAKLLALSGDIIGADNLLYQYIGNNEGIKGRYKK